jgi:uncharacterized protein
MARADRSSSMSHLVRWLAVLLAFVCPLAFAQADAPRGADDLLAVPPLARVTDLAGALKGGEKAALEQKLAAFETARGAQIAVLIVPSTKPEPIEDFAHRVGEAWKIGRRGVGDGLLIVVATQDRRARIDVARSLEGAVPDAIARRLISETMGPRFREGDFAGGISATLDRVFRLIEGESLPTPVGVPQHKVDAGEDVMGVLLPFVIGGVIVGGLLRRVIGKPGALLAGGGAGGLAGFMLASATLGIFAGVAVLVLSLFGGMGGGRSIGGRRGGVFLPGGWGGGGGWSGGGGGGWSGGGGGWSSGGGGDFSGGGASGDW